MIYKTEQHNHQTYVLFQDAIRLLKGNRNYKKKKKKESDRSVPNIHLLWLECGVKAIRQWNLVS